MPNYFYTALFNFFAEFNLQVYINSLVLKNVDCLAKLMDNETS